MQIVFIVVAAPFLLPACAPQDSTENEIRELRDYVERMEDSVDMHADLVWSDVETRYEKTKTEIQAGSRQLTENAQASIDSLDQRMERAGSDFRDWQEQTAERRISDFRRSMENLGNNAEATWDDVETEFEEMGNWIEKTSGQWSDEIDQEWQNVKKEWQEWKEERS